MTTRDRSSPQMPIVGRPQIGTSSPAGPPVGASARDVGGTATGEPGDTSLAVRCPKCYAPPGHPCTFQHCRALDARDGQRVEGATTREQTPPPQWRAAHLMALCQMCGEAITRHRSEVGYTAVNRHAALSGAGDSETGGGRTRRTRDLARRLYLGGSCTPHTTLTVLSTTFASTRRTYAPTAGCCAKLCV